MKEIAHCAQMVVGMTLGWAAMLAPSLTQLEPAPKCRNASVMDDKGQRADKGRILSPAPPEYLGVLSA